MVIIEVSVVSLFFLNMVCYCCLLLLLFLVVVVVVSRCCCCCCCLMCVVLDASIVVGVVVDFVCCIVVVVVYSSFVVGCCSWCFLFMFNWNNRLLSVMLWLWLTLFFVCIVVVAVDTRCTSMAFYDERLFSCGIEPHSLVEWDYVCSISFSHKFFNPPFTSIACISSIFWIFVLLSSIFFVLVYYDFFNYFHLFSPDGVPTRHHFLFPLFVLIVQTFYWSVLLFFFFFCWCFQFFFVVAIWIFFLLFVHANFDYCRLTVRFRQDMPTMRVIMPPVFI